LLHHSLPRRHGKEAEVLHSLPLEERLQWQAPMLRHASRCQWHVVGGGGRHAWHCVRVLPPAGLTSSMRVAQTESASMMLTNTVTFLSLLPPISVRTASQISSHRLESSSMGAGWDPAADAWAWPATTPAASCTTYGCTTPPCWAVGARCQAVQMCPPMRCRPPESFADLRLRQAAIRDRSNYSIAGAVGPLPGLPGPGPPSFRELCCAGPRSRCSSSRCSNSKRLTSSRTAWACGRGAMGTDSAGQSAVGPNFTGQVTAFHADAGLSCGREISRLLPSYTGGERRSNRRPGPGLVYTVPSACTTTNALPSAASW
jgi:hypothetical protein